MSLVAQPGSSTLEPPCNWTPYLHDIVWYINVKYVWCSNSNFVICNQQSCTLGPVENLKEYAHEQTLC